MRQYTLVEDSIGPFYINNAKDLLYCSQTMPCRIPDEPNPLLRLRSIEGSHQAESIALGDVQIRLGRGSGIAILPSLRGARKVYILSDAHLRHIAALDTVGNLMRGRKKEVTMRADVDEDRSSAGQDRKSAWDVEWAKQRHNYLFNGGKDKEGDAVNEMYANAPRFEVCAGKLM